MLRLNGMLSVSNLLLLLFLLEVMSSVHMTNTEISLDAPGTSVRLSLENVFGSKATWTSVGRLHDLCRTTVDDVVVKARTYYRHILCRAKKMGPSLVRRMMIFVADALEGKVIYAKLLPRISGLYCDGRATFAALKFVHDVEKIVKARYLKHVIEWPHHYRAEDRVLKYKQTTTSA